MVVLKADLIFPLKQEKKNWDEKFSSVTLESFSERLFKGAKRGKKKKTPATCKKVKYLSAVLACIAVFVFWS